jgi:O-antigen ligase
MTKTERILKYLVYIGLVILLATPFIFIGDLYFPYITGKSFVFRVIVEILIAIWLILAILYPKYRPKKSWILISFILFTLSLFISNLFGVDQTVSLWGNLMRMEGWITIVHLLGLFIVLGSVLNTKKEWYTLFKVSLIGSFIMFILSVEQTIGFIKTPDDYDTWGGLYRIYTTIGNPAFLAIYTLFNAFLSLLLIFKDKDRVVDLIKRTKETLSKNWPILFYILTFILNTWMLFQTGTRGSMLGFIGGLVLIGLIMAFLEKEKTIYKKIALGFFAAAILFAGLIFSLKDSSFVQNNLALSRITSIFEVDNSIQVRINNWIHASRGFQERPILGWGQENFNYVFDKYHLPRNTGLDLSWYDRAHNILFEWLIAGGIFGLLFYLSVWVTTVLSIFKTPKFQNNEKAILISMLAGYFVHLLFNFDTIISYLYFIFIIAFVYVVKTKNKTVWQYEFSDSLKKILISAIILIIPFTVYLINYHPYKAAEEILLAKKVVDKNSDGQYLFYHKNPIIDNIELFKKIIARDTFATAEAREEILNTGMIILKLENDNQETQEYFNSLKTQYLLYAYNEINKQIDETPNDSRYPFIFSELLAKSGQLEMAEKYAAMAIKLSPTKQIIRTPLIRIYTATGQSDKALELAKETYELDDSKLGPWVEYLKVAANFDKDLYNELIQDAIDKGNKYWIEYAQKKLDK